MTRKKKPPQNPKRQQITDSNGWTHISRSRKPINFSPEKNNNTPSPAEIPNGQTLLDLQKSHTHYREQWLPSTCYQNLQTILKTDFTSSFPSFKRIDRCITLGLGSLSNGRRSSWWELVFLESVLDFLSPSPITEEEEEEEARNKREKSHNEKLQIFIQDPVFNDLDVAFFQTLGFTALSDPEAFDHITPSTFLFAPHLEIEVYERALEKAKPRLCVGTDLGECLDRYVSFPSCSS